MRKHFVPGSIFPKESLWYEANLFPYKIWDLNANLQGHSLGVYQLEKSPASKKMPLTISTSLPPQDLNFSTSDQDAIYSLADC